jgi:DNA-binding GntR family transcriptional regulator
MGDAAYERLRSAIVGRRLTPGAALAETELAEALGVSRTPVREALTRLQLEGLVSRDRSGRLTVARLSREKVADLFEIRMLLECYAAQLAAERISDDELAALEVLLAEDRAALQAGSIEDLAAINHRFHDVVVRAARNRALVALMRTLSHRLVGLTPFAVGDRQSQANFVAQHASLLRLVRDGDGAGAAALVRDHLVQARDLLLQGVDTQETDDDGDSLARLLHPTDHQAPADASRPD